jgi:hypothetical protein
MELQQRLLKWTHNQYKHRTLECNALSTSLSELLHDVVDSALHSCSYSNWIGNGHESILSYLSSSFFIFCNKMSVTKTEEINKPKLPSGATE